MTNEKLKILEMLQEGTITADDAARLLESVGGEESKSEAPKPAVVDMTAKNPVVRGKKIRIEVRGVDEGEKINVNVSVPIALARFADNIIDNCLPEQVSDTLEDKGINLRGLNLTELIDVMENLDEDIVNVDVNNDDTDMKVRVYVE